MLEIASHEKNLRQAKRLKRKKVWPFQGGAPDAGHVSGILGLAAFSVLIFSSPAYAFIEDIIEVSPYSLRVGPAVIFDPDFEGASHYKAHLLPAIDFRWKKLVIFHDDTLKIDLLQKPWASFGPIVTYNSGRKESSSPALMGLGNIGKGAEVGGYAETLIGPIALKLDVQKEVAGGHGGLTAHLIAGCRVYKSQNLSIFAGGRISYASGRYMQTFFGVTPAQAALSGLSSYRAGAGVKDIGAGVILSYLISDHWTLTGVTAYSRLVDDAAASPLVKNRGSANQFTQVFKLSYLF